MSFNQSGISHDQWKNLEPKNYPFLKYEFYEALIQSHSIGKDSGWMPIPTISTEGGILSYLKTHSYGEYIFDWDWANAYHKLGLSYYPKLTTMVPFTPATVPHFLMREFDEKKVLKLFRTQDEFYKQKNISSNHYLFLHPDERPVFEHEQYLIRESMQYHFHNQDYKNFDEYLGSMKTKKAKNIRLERSFPGIHIKKFTGTDLTEDHAKSMYQFYLSTIDSKNSNDYLKEEFFISVFKSMKSQILYIEATYEDGPIAGSLFFYDSERLYGRYWGCTRFIENLHFELCYYQGIEFCLDKKLKVFEAGAQGEHKIQRGFRPVRTYSAHHLKHPLLSQAISHYINEEKIQIEQAINYLETKLPFK